LSYSSAAIDGDGHGLCSSRCDGQLAFSYKLHDVGVVGVGWIKRHEAGHAVDVAADARHRAVEAVYILSIVIHDQSSADALTVQLSAVLLLTDWYAELFVNGVNTAPDPLLGVEVKVGVVLIST